MYYLDILALTAINCLLALAAYLPISRGLLVVCFGAFMSVGAVVAAGLYSGGTVSFLAAILLGGAVSAGMGIMVAIIAAKTEGFVFAILTLSVGEFVRVIAVNWEMLGGALGYKNVTGNQSVIWPLGMFVLFVALFSLFDRTRMRGALDALREDEELASALGVSRMFHNVAVLMIGAAIAGLAGGLYIHHVGILDPRNFGALKSIEILMFPIIGGSRRFWGPVLGAIFLTVLPEVLRVSLTLRMLIYGIIVVLVTVLLPDGLSGLFSRLVPGMSKEAT